ncbi:MAG: S-adenosyl-L-methionine-dependent methyltransferase [Linnemannia gamsii]|nr:MAG: S-adenosyl-L-methionine-dependent methyltransferase [Linnemannia gamsii]
MEMANEFPDATVTGIDMSPVFPTTIIPENCRFLQHNILDPLPFPDNTFDYIHQRLLVAGLKPRDWVYVLQELERVTKPGGWVELVEVDGHGGNNGPMTAQLWNWIEQTLKERGINVNIGTELGLQALMQQANLINIKHEVFHVPTGLHGGKIGTLLKENEQAFWIAMAPTVIHGTGVDIQEYEDAIFASTSEVEIYKSYHTFYSACGQKRLCPLPSSSPLDPGECSPVSPIPAPLSPLPSFKRNII